MAQYVALMVPPETRDRIKILAAKEGISMIDMIDLLVSKYEQAKMR